MIDFDFRKINILNVLLNNEFVDIDELLQRCDISLRTALSEINEMNRILCKEPNNIQILNQRGKGYFLDYSIEAVDRIEVLKNHCKDYLNLSINVRLGSYERVTFIARQFFIANKPIKGEDLAEQLNVSLATLNKDLRMVRNYLNMYNLSILSTPYYGMKLCGDELAIRSCMIDFCDIYNFSDENIFEQNSLKQYSISREQLLEKKRFVQKNLKEYSYPITDAGFRRLVIYLFIFPLREDSKQKKEWSDKEAFMKLKEYTLAEKLIGKEASEDELMYLTIFVLSNIEIHSFNNWEQLSEIVPEAQVIFEEVFSKLKSKNRLDLDNYKELKEYLLHFFYKHQLRKKYNIFEYEMSNARKKMIKRVSASFTLAIYIYHYMKDDINEDYYDMIFWELVITIYNLVYKIKNEYNETNIVIVNENGFIANNSIIGKLKLEQFNVKFHYHYLYEIDTLDYSSYDYLFISDAYTCELKNIPIPTLKIDFLLKEGMGDYIWNKVISKNRKIGAVSKYLQNPVITSLSSKASQLSEEIAEFFINKNYLNPKMSRDSFEKLIFNIIYNADYENFSTTKYLNLFAADKVEKNYFVFNLEKEVVIKHKNVKSIHFIILDLAKGPVEIKNGDSEIRRYIE